MAKIIFLFYEATVAVFGLVIDMVIQQFSSKLIFQYSKQCLVNFFKSLIVFMKQSPILYVT